MREMQAKQSTILRYEDNLIISDITIFFFA
jgi:hypothetical protein